MDSLDAVDGQQEADAVAATYKRTVTVTNEAGDEVFSGEIGYDAEGTITTDNGTTFTVAAEVAGSFEIAQAESTFTAGEDKALNLQVGANSGWDQVIKINVEGISAQILGLSEDMTTTKEDGVKGTSNLIMDTTKDAQDAINKIDKALNMVNEQRGQLGAVQNRLEYTITNLDTAAENLQSAESRIRARQHTQRHSRTCRSKRDSAYIGGGSACG